MSYNKSLNLKEYAMKRIKRIYPAYFFVIMFCAFVSVFLMKKLNSKFLLGLIKYIYYNLIFLKFIQPTLSGVFVSNLGMSEINGALWTLKVEVGFYILVPILSYFTSKFERIKIHILIFIYCIDFSFYKIMIELANSSGNKIYSIMEHQLLAQLPYFLSVIIIY